MAIFKLLDLLPIIILRKFNQNSWLINWNKVENNIGYITKLNRISY
jgi:hypothetical protein